MNEEDVKKLQSDIRANIGNLNKLQDKLKETESELSFEGIELLKLKASYYDMLVKLTIGN